MKAALTGLLVLLALSTAGAETRSLSLENRSAEELESLLLPLAGPGVDMTADGQRLVLQGAADRLDALEQAARALDHPPRDLWLRLRSLSGPPPGDPSESRRHTTADPRAVSLRLREGQTVTWDRALLQRITGDRTLATGRKGPLLLEEGRHLWLHQGLQARVQVLGGRFVAELAAAGDQGGEGLRRDRLATTVSGPLGRWVVVQMPGAAPPASDVRRHATRSAAGSGLELRVDPAGP